MPRKDPPKPKVKAKDYPAQVDAFTRIDGETARRFDELAEDAHRSRSSQIAYLIDRFVEEEYPKMLQRRRTVDGTN